MKKKFKKLVAAVLTMAMTMSVGLPAFAAETEDNVYNFLLNKDAACEALNAVAQTSPLSVNEIALYDGAILTEEVRELQVNDELRIVNTRRILERASRFEVSDSYELFYMGSQGGAGELVAYYEYETSSLGSEVATRVIDAYGEQNDLLSSLYAEGTCVPNFNNAALVWNSASVTFNLRQNMTFSTGIIGGNAPEIWRAISYEHTIEFDNRGLCEMYWG